MPTKRQWDLITKERRNSFLQEIITFFAEQRDEEIGVIAAEEILDFFLQNIGSDIYNKGIENSKKLLKERFDDLELGFDLLKHK